MVVVTAIKAIGFHFGYWFLFFYYTDDDGPPNCWEGIDDTKMHLVNELRDADLSLSAFHPGEHSI